MPVLTRVRREYVQRTGEEDALRAARALLVAGVADPTDWWRVKAEPVDFISRTVERWIVAGYGDMRRHPGLHLVLALDAESACWYAGMWVEGPFGVQVGPTLRLLEHYHPRLPASFLHVFNHTVWKIAGTFGVDELEQYIEWEAERELEEEAGDAPDGMAVTNAFEVLIERKRLEYVPESLRRAPLSYSALRTACRRLPPTSVAAELMRRVLALPRLAEPLKRSAAEIRRARETIDDSDWGEPWPMFVLPFDAGDQVAAAYDDFEEMKFHGGMVDPPSYVVPFDMQDSASLRMLRDRIVNLCRLAGHLMEVACLMPDRDMDPRSLVNVLGGEVGADAPVQQLVRVHT